MAIGIFSSTFSNPDSNGLDSERNNKDNLLWQESNNSNTNTVNAKQIYSSHGNIIAQIIIESGINGTKVQVSYEGMGQFTNGGPKVTEYWIYINNHRSDGVIQGEGNGKLVYNENNNTNSKHRFCQNERIRSWVYRFKWEYHVLSYCTTIRYTVK